jgi:membrane-bound inhibitor of C-type lysozyme
MSISKFILACSIACASLALTPVVHAADKAQTETKKKPAAKSKKAAKPAADSAASKENSEDAVEPNIAENSVTEYGCELGNKITIYSNAGDIEHIALRWKQKLLRLTRVATTTGAQRFENKLHGLIWIGIPAKGMLLDSKANRQLANECKTSEQKLGL